MGLFYFQQSIFSILLNNLTILFMSKILTLIIFCALLLNGCTIEKKRYSNGYHTTWNVQKFIPKKTTATNFKSEKYSLLNIPKSEEDKNNRDDKASIDTIQKNNVTTLTFGKVNSKIKKQHLSISNTDTVPETKSPNPTEVKSAEKYNQEEKDFKRILRSWLSLAISTVAFFVSIPILVETDAGVAWALFGLGFVGVVVSIILIITYTIIKNKHLDQSHIYYKQDTVGTPIANPNVPRDQEEIASKVTDLNKKIKRYNIVRFTLLPLSILTFTYLFLFGMASLVLFSIYTSKRKRLIAVKNNLLNIEPKTNPASKLNTQNTASLQEKLEKLKKKMRINKIFMVLSCLTIIIMAAEASTAALSAIPAVVLALLISILIQIIWSVKKTNVSDELNLIH